MRFDYLLLFSLVYTDCNGIVSAATPTGYVCVFKKKYFRSTFWVGKRGALYKCNFPTPRVCLTKKKSPNRHFPSNSCDQMGWGKDLFMFICYWMLDALALARLDHREVPFSTFQVANIMRCLQPFILNDYYIFDKANNVLLVPVLPSRVRVRRQESKKEKDWMYFFSHVFMFTTVILWRFSMETKTVFSFL